MTDFWRGLGESVSRRKANPEIVSSILTPSPHSFWPLFLLSGWLGDWRTGVKAAVRITGGDKCVKQYSNARQQPPVNFTRKSMLQITLREVKEAFGEVTMTGQLIPGPLHRLASAPLPVGVSFSIGRTFDDVERLFKGIEQRRLDIGKKYGEPIGDAAQGQWRVLPEKLPEFDKEVDAMLTETVEINGRKLTLQELAGVKLSGMDARALAFLIVEEPVETKPAPVTEIAEGRKAKKAAR